MTIRPGDRVQVVGRESDGQWVVRSLGPDGEYAHIALAEGPVESGPCVPTDWLRLVEPPPPPKGTVLRDRGGKVWRLYEGRWWGTGTYEPATWAALCGHAPLTTLIPAPDPDDDALVTRLVDAYSGEAYALPSRAGICAVLRALRSVAES